MTTRPHDALFKAAFETPAHAAGIFFDLLPASIRDAIAWDTMALEPSSFIDPELADDHGDLLFSVRLHGEGRALVYLLLEHQSTGDNNMPLRLLVYFVRTWERWRKEHPGAPLPPIIPAIVSHVPGGWTAPTGFAALLDPAPLALAGLAAFVPGCSVLVADLAHLSNDDIQALGRAAFPRLALWVLRDGRDARRLLDNLAHWSAAFHELTRTPSGMPALAQLLRYIWLVTNELTLEEFRARLREQVPRAEEVAMTIAEQLHHQGRAEGLAEGHARALGATLRKQLALKFGSIDAEHAARIEAAAPDELDRYLERVLTADTLAAVFVG